MRRIIALSLVLSGCGLEGIVQNAGDNEHERPVTAVRGSLLRPVTKLEFINPAGAVIEPYDVDLFDDRYALDLFSSEYEKGLIVATAGEVRLTRYVGPLARESEIAGINLDADSTATALLIDVYLAAFEKPFTAIEAANVEKVQERARALFESDADARLVRDTVAMFIGAANSMAERRVFLDPKFEVVTEPDPNNPDATITRLVAEEQTVNQDWLQRQSFTFDAAAFDRALGAAALLIQLEGCADPNFIRTVFEVNFGTGQLDANCGSIVRDRWVRGVSDSGKQMWFVGGVHEESEQPSDATLRSELNSTMGNRGGWNPNVVPMYDDGTNGDEVGGDNIWTVTFVLPRGMRAGYKYTWGKQGDLWTGTEEWPGNQRILEIVDVNGDNFVRRRDSFGDETTNKDRVNGYSRGTGSVTWDTDANDDMYLDARETPLDLNNDCTPDELVTPTTVPLATVECGTLAQ
jgi:hypothetical protein